MARASYFILFVFLIFFSAVVSISGEEYNYVKRVDPKKMKMKMLKEKTSHFRLYWHDIIKGPNATSVQIIKPVDNSSATFFGAVQMIDNPLTIKPKLSSKMVGRAEGLYASAGQKDIGFLMVMNFVFSEGKYNGSTFTILGRNNADAKVREMPIIGGSGLFRFARGYVQANTVELPVNGNAVIEYNAYVIHY